jgi:hypothetical protein
MRSTRRSSAQEPTSRSAYVIETDTLGNKVIYTNQEERASCGIRRSSPTPTKFDPLFAIALSWHLASLLAGPDCQGRCRVPPRPKRCAADDG